MSEKFTNLVKGNKLHYKNNSYYEGGSQIDENELE